jgi:hypothetical protein
MRTRRLWVLIVALLLGPPAHADVWQFLFGLSGDNTAYDFMSAPDSRGVAFVMKLCDSGVCLYESDWTCGFENNDDESKVEYCFWSLITKVPPWVKLDRIRKFCGVTLAQFTGPKITWLIRCAALPLVANGGSNLRSPFRG